MKAKILMNLFEWNQHLQIGTAHRLTTSLETFRDLVQIIESNEGLAKQVKRIRWAHGSEEIETITGNRYMVKAGASAARGISKPETVFIDETREMKDETTWASLRYTMMAADNPQLWTLSNAGDQHSLVLNQLRERGLAAAMGGTNDDIGWFEWSSDYDAIDDSPRFWAGAAMANPALGHTVHIDNLKAVLNDPPDVVRTEVLCRWVQTISAAIPSDSFAFFSRTSTVARASFSSSLPTAFPAPTKWLCRTSTLCVIAKPRRRAYRRRIWLTAFWLAEFRRATSEVSMRSPSISSKIARMATSWSRWAQAQ